MTITGTNLSGVTGVTIGGTPATLGANTATSIVVTAPAGTAGAKDVVVTTAGGSATSTGGFTHCLLERGATRVYAVDVGHGQLAWTLRNDQRVGVMEHTNIRHLANLPEPVQCVVIDVSFISLRLVSPAIVPLLDQVHGEQPWVIALVKPQFEVGRELVGKGGIVRDEAAQLTAVEKIRQSVFSLGCSKTDMVESPILGAEGNREFLLYAQF